MIVKKTTTQRMAVQGNRTRSNPPEMLNVTCYTSVNVKTRRRRFPLAREEQRVMSWESTPVSHHGNIQNDTL